MERQLDASNTVIDAAHAAASEAKPWWWSRASMKKGESEKRPEVKMS